MRSTLAGLLLLVFNLAAGADPVTDAWHVARVSGEVWVTRAGSDVPEPALAQAHLPGCSVLSTAADGRAMLTHGSLTMVVGPATVVLACQGGQSTIVDGGRWAKDDDHDELVRPPRNPQPAFDLGRGSPLLAAMVKG